MTLKGPSSQQADGRPYGAARPCAVWSPVFCDCRHGCSLRRTGNCREEPGLVAQEMRIAGDATRARVCSEFNREPVPCDVSSCSKKPASSRDRPAGSRVRDRSRARPNRGGPRQAHPARATWEPAPSRIIIYVPTVPSSSIISTWWKMPTRMFRLVVDIAAASDRQFERGACRADRHDRLHPNHCQDRPPECA